MLPLELRVLILSRPELVQFYGVLRCVHSSFKEAIDLISHTNLYKLNIRVIVKSHALWNWAITEGGLKYNKYNNVVVNKFTSECIVNDVRSFVVKYGALSVIKQTLTKEDVKKTYVYVDEAALRGSLSAYQYISSELNSPTSITTATAAIQGGNPSILARLFNKHCSLLSWAPYPACVSAHYTVGIRDKVLSNFVFECIEANHCHMLQYILDAYILPLDQSWHSHISTFSLSLDHLLAAVQRGVSKKFILCIIPRIDADRGSVLHILVNNDGARVIRSKYFKKSDSDLRVLFELAWENGNSSLCKWLYKTIKSRGITFDPHPFINRPYINPVLIQWLLQIIQN